MSQITIRSFTGAGIKAHIPSIARLRFEMFREFPFLQTTDLNHEIAYLKKLSQCNDAIAVMIFDKQKPVGVSLGIPLEEEAPHLQKPLVSSGINPACCFYLSSSLLLKPYRGRGLGHHFFDLREAHAKHLKRFSHLCFCTVSRPNKPKDYTSPENFWKKRGYAPNLDVKGAVSWIDLHEELETSKELIFWTKHLQG